MSKSGGIRTAIGQIKARLNRYMAEEAVQIPEVDTDLSNQENLTRMEAVRDCLESEIDRAQRAMDALESQHEKWTNLINSLFGEELNEELEHYNRTTTAPDNFITVMDEAVDAIEITKAKLKVVNGKIAHLNKLIGVVLESPNEEREGSLRGRPEAVMATNRPIDLPRLKLPTYDGDPMKWIEFWEEFEADVHNQDIANTQKFKYLRSTLSGRARQAIQAIPVSSQGYQEAIDTLKRKFGSTEILKTYLYNQLEKLPVSSGRTDDLRDTFEKIEQVCCQLKSIGEDMNHPSIILSIQKKLPPLIVEEVRKLKPADHVWGLDELKDQLDSMIRRKEVVRYITQDEPKRKQGTPFEKHNRSRGAYRRDYTSAKTFTTLSRSNRGATGASFKRELLPCVFCGEKHLHSQCEKYKTLEARRERVKELQLCFQCLRTGHLTRQCRSTRKCSFCEGNHNRALCFHEQRKYAPATPRPYQAKGNQKPSYKPTMKSHPTKTHSVIQNSNREEEETEIEENLAANVTIASQEKNYEVVLLTAKAKVRNPESSLEQGDQFTVSIFFDSGSQRSYITEALAKKLNLKKKGEDTLGIYTFASDKLKKVTCPKVEVGIILKDGSIKKIRASALPMLTTKLQRTALPAKDLEYVSQISSAKFANDIPKKNETVVPDILIGSDYFWGFLEPESIIQCPSGLYLIPSKVGLLLGGEKETQEKGATSNTYAIITSSEEERNVALEIQQEEVMTANMEDFWSLETIGIKDSLDVKDDDCAVQQFNDSIAYEEGRYQVRWPWKPEPQLPDNYGLCYGRLKSLMKRLQDEPELLKQYDDIIQDQLTKGIVEKVNEETEGRRRLHYLPHLFVMKEGKMRIVYDASAKAGKNANSLNDCIYRGMVMLPDLCGLLLRFRKAPIAMTADIEKAFLQLGLQMVDRDVTRFLWVKDLKKPVLPENIQIYRFCRVTFGVIASPFLLSATLDYHLRKHGGEQGCELVENIYVDNVLTGVNTVREASQFYKNAKKLFSQVSMNLRDWASNSKEFYESIPEKDKQKGTRVKVLGIIWDTEEDTLQVSTCSRPEEGSPVTKREVLQTIASTFDPLGIVSPVILKSKIFFQNLWRERYDWDDPLPQEKVAKWEEIMHDLAQKPKFTIPRHVAPQGKDHRYQLMTFVDASKDAYAAVVYLRVESDAATEIYLLFSKNRLAPKKETSIPRLELMAAVIGVRATKFVAEQLHLTIDKKVIWSDSECVLHWIQSPKPLATFVANRIKEIRAEKDIHFRYISTHENPADLATRGVKSDQLDKETIWWQGPAWLKAPAEQWPIWNLREIQPDVLREAEKETKGPKPFHVMMAKVTQRKEVQPLVDATRVSTWPKLLRVTAYCLQFLKQKIWDRLPQETKTRMQTKLKLLSQMSEKKGIDAQSLKVAATSTLIQVQRAEFNEVHEALTSNQKNFLVQQLGISKDKEGILRCYGRLANVDAHEDTKYPVLLPRKNHVTRLIIMDRHQRVLHSGTQHTLAQVRQEFWIPKGRMEVQTTLRDCFVCKRYLVGPYSLPKMPTLPEERVVRAAPFQHTGLDYLGPLWIKIGEEKKKVWICLFTCMVTRAIHLEPTLDLSAEQFLNCVRRFIARRGRPDKIVSDNAPQFKLTQKTMDSAWESIWNDESNANYFAQQKINWYFITEYAPWQGGFYERLVGVVKQALRKAIGRRCLSFDQFYTLLPEVEAVVNSRPLTHIYDEMTSKEILRPVDLLGTQNEIGIPPLEEDHDDEEYLPPGVDSKQKLLQVWKKGLKNLDKFWELWQDEYLLSLRERMQSSHKGPRIQANIAPQVDEIVLVKEEGIPRGSWKLGKITNLKKGRDGKIRSAKILLPNKTIIKRPINLLYPLEVSEGGGRPDVTTIKESDEEIPEDSKESEDKKLAEKDDVAQQARQRRQVNMSYLINTTMAIFCFCLIGAKGSPCPDNAKLTRVESQRCTSEGYVVMRTEQEYLCWVKKKCPMGHLQDKGVCGPRCACPKWATECSYHEGPAPAVKGDLKAILDLAQPNVCAFKPDSRCNENPSHIQLHQIQLYNGSLSYVKSLELRYTQGSAEEYECLGEGRMVGTPEFCGNHECAKSGTKFCYYRSNERVFFVNQNGEIPIKAWGSVPVTIYGPKMVPPENPVCIECSLKCIQGGIEISMEENIGQLEACSKPYCYQVSHPKKIETVLFPKDVLVYAHEVTVKFWSNGYLIRDMGIHCEPSPFCEMVKCYLCWELIGNPQCAPKWALFIVFLMVYFGSVSLYIIIKLIKYGLQCCYYSTYFSWQCLRFCRIIGRRARSKTYERVYLPVYTMLQQDAAEDEQENDQETALHTPKINSKLKSIFLDSKRRAAIMSIVSIVILMDKAGMAMACAEVTTMTAQQSMCTVREGGSMECILTEATRLALVPQGQDSCLLIKDPNGQPIGTLSVETEKITLECQVKNEYFTRSFSMKVASSTRCPGMGSCIDDRCRPVKVDTKLKELEGEANDLPGFTYCTESCGGWSCGCAVFVSGCLFYRTYAAPASDTVYEVFSCPVWEYLVKATIRLNLQNEHTQQTLELKPGVVTTWRNMKLTLTSITSPPVPILGTKFLTDGTRTTIVQASASGQPVAGTVGELQCASREKAGKFDCYIPHDSCNCQGQETQVACNCAESKLEDLFNKMENVLPLTAYGIALSGTGNKIEASYDKIASLELQVSMEGFRLSMQTDKNKCEMKPLEMAGCYNCLNGAKLKYECRTDFGEAVAHVTCGEGRFSTICTPQGIKATAVMNFKHAAVKEVCTVECPAGTTTFSIDANLVFIEKERFGQLSNVISVPQESTGFEWNGIDWGFLTAWLSGNWLASLIAIGSGATILLLSAILLPFILQIMMSCATRSSTILFGGLLGRRRQRLLTREL